VSEAVVLATRNAGKLRELAPIFAAAGIAVVDLASVGMRDESSDEETLEVHSSFEANALAKARFFAARLGRACVADDSGLEVVALRGAPGVRSRRWARDEGVVDGAGASEDEANNALLIDRLGGVTDRRARFVCAAAYCGGGRELSATGVVDGTVTLVARGGGGFGYDPFFHVGALGKTLAEATLDEKEAVSHRGAAFRALLAQLRRSMAAGGD
jgi:XTP/dITP diphosphohydrolase